MAILAVSTIDNGIDPARFGWFGHSHASCVFHTFRSWEFILALKNQRSPGSDGIPAEFYKATASFVSFPLSIISNISYHTGELPSIWKYAAITPVFKKGASSDSSNYWTNFTDLYGL